MTERLTWGQLWRRFWNLFRAMPATCETCGDPYYPRRHVETRGCITARQSQCEVCEPIPRRIPQAMLDAMRMEYGPKKSGKAIILGGKAPTGNRGTFCL